MQEVRADKDGHCSLFLIRIDVETPDQLTSAFSDLLFRMLALLL